jgi:putative ABC transport system permease protein
MALATAILVGALIVGDSVRYSLQQMVSDRLVNTNYSLEMGDRYFRIQLADNLNEILGAEVAALLQTKGIAILTGGSSKAHHTQVIGVDKHFENIGSTPSSYYDMENNEVIINQQLAAQLDLKPGDEFLLRLLKIDYLSKDAPFSGDSDLSIVKRVRVKAIATVLEFGHFNLKSNQIVPNTVFMSLLNLSKMMDIKNKANTLLIADRTNDPVQMSQLESAMEEAWSLNDIGLYFDTLKTHNQIELKSERIFLEENITQAVYKTGTHPLPVFTYFVNELRAGKK